MKINSILYADDDLTMRILVDFTFTLAGQSKVHLCSSGHEALHQATQLRPDLLLLDAEMSGLDGIATLRQLRRMPNTADTPVIFLSRNARPEDIESYFSHGAIGFIPKPINSLHDFYTIVASIWKGNNWTRALTSQQDDELAHQYQLAH